MLRKVRNWTHRLEGPIHTRLVGWFWRQVRVFMHPILFIFSCVAEWRSLKRQHGDKGGDKGGVTMYRDASYVVQLTVLNRADHAQATSVLWRDARKLSAGIMLAVGEIARDSPAALNWRTDLEVNGVLCTQLLQFKDFQESLLSWNYNCGPRVSRDKLQLKEQKC